MINRINIKIKDQNKKNCIKKSKSLYKKINSKLNFYSI